MKTHHNRLSVLRKVTPKTPLTLSVMIRFHEKGGYHSGSQLSLDTNILAP